MKPHKISTHLAYSDNCYFHLFLSVVWLSWNFAEFNFKMNLKVSAFYLEKQKSFITKRKKIGCCQYQNKKTLFTDSIFQKVLVKMTYINAARTTKNILSSSTNCDTLCLRLTVIKTDWCDYRSFFQKPWHTFLSYFFFYFFRRYPM